MTASTIIVLGSVNTDLVDRGPGLPRAGETVLRGEFYRAQGGKGANRAAAVSVTQAGAQPSLPRRDEIEVFCVKE